MARIPKRKTAAALAVLAFLVPAACRADAMVTAHVGAADQLVISGDDVELLGVEFWSLSGSLIPSDDVAPFAATLSNREQRITMYSTLGEAVLLSGDLTLAARWNRDGPQDVLFRYGTWENEPEFRPVWGHSAANTGPVVTSPVVAIPVVDLGPSRIAPEPATLSLSYCMLLMLLACQRRSRRD